MSANSGSVSAMTNTTSKISCVGQRASSAAAACLCAAMRSSCRAIRGISRRFIYDASKMYALGQGRPRGISNVWAGKKRGKRGGYVPRKGECAVPRGCATVTIATKIQVCNNFKQQVFKLKGLYINLCYNLVIKNLFWTDLKSIYCKDVHYIVSSLISSLILKFI